MALRFPKLRWFRRAIWILGGALLFYVAALLTAHLVPLPPRLSTPSSTVVEFRDGSYAYVFLSPDQRWRIAVQRFEVDPAYVEALIRFEDKRFWHHPGVDPFAVVRA